MRRRPMARLAEMTIVYVCKCISLFVFSAL